MFADEESAVRKCGDGAGDSVDRKDDVSDRVGAGEDFAVARLNEQLRVNQR